MCEVCADGWYGAQCQLTDVKLTVKYVSNPVSLCCMAKKLYGRKPVPHRLFFSTHRADIDSFNQDAFMSQLDTLMGQPITLMSVAAGSVVVTTGMSEASARDAVAFAQDGRLASIGVESLSVQGQAAVVVGM